MENNDLKYSVLMSVYKNDVKEQLQDAIESMLSQSVKPEQFVIVIDGPVPKELSEMVNEYSIRNSNLFTIVRLEKNGGLGNALNNGIKQCRNELIARMDSDDISKKNRCEKQLEKFKENPNLCVLGTQIDEFIGDTDNIISHRVVPTEYEDILKFSKRRSPFNHPTVMYKKSVLVSHGGYTPYGRKEDLDLFVRLVNEDCYCENLNESLLFYRTNEDNLKRRKTWINCKEYIQVMFEFYRKKYISFSDFLYVLIGQLVMYLLPISMVKTLSDNFLRESEKNE